MNNIINCYSKLCKHNNIIKLGLFGSILTDQSCEKIESLEINNQQIFNYYIKFSFYVKLIWGWHFEVNYLVS